MEREILKSYRMRDKSVGKANKEIVQHFRQKMPQILKREQWLRSHLSICHSRSAYKQESRQVQSPCQGVPR